MVSYRFLKCLCFYDNHVVKYRNLPLDFGNGITTNTKILDLATGKGSLPGVPLAPVPGKIDM